MLPLYIFTLLVSAAFSLDIACEDGKQISSQDIKDAKDMVGNWTYTYHWDNKNKYSSKFVAEAEDRILKCPEIEIEPIAPEFVKENQEKCGDKPMPFKWEDAKLKLKAPLMNIEDSIIFMGDKQSWMFVSCDRMLRVEARKVSDDVIVMINPDVEHISEMLVRKPIKLSELKCLSKNVDVGKDMNGIGLCY